MGRSVIIHEEDLSTKTDKARDKVASLAKSDYLGYDVSEFVLPNGSIIFRFTYQPTKLEI